MCELYNAALEERRGAWKWEKRSVSYFDQCRTLTSLRDVRPEILTFGVTVCRGTLERLDRSFCLFYRRCKSGERPGYPRFKSRARFHSAQWEDTSGWRLDEQQRRLYLQGVGAVKVKIHQSIRGAPKAITVKQVGRHYYVYIRCVDVPAQILPSIGREIGIDLGVNNLVATSEGELVSSGHHEKRAAERLEKAQQVLRRRHRRSVRRQKAKEELARLHRQVAQWSRYQDRTEQSHR